MTEIIQRMTFRHKIKRRLMMEEERFHQNSAVRNEIFKYRDPRRKEITERTVLTNEQKKEIDCFYIENYGRKIPYTWHQHFSSYTGNFDVCYFPEHLYIPKLERFMNSAEYARVLGDKCVLPMIADAMGIKTAETVFYVSRNVFRDSNYHIISREKALSDLDNIGEVYLKISVDSGGGEGCFRADFEQGADKITGKSTEEYIAEIGSEFIVQRVIETLPELEEFDKGSAATFRVISYFWRGVLYTCPLTLRIGIHGSPVANAAIIIAVDDDGCLHSKGYSKYGEVFTEHPDSHLKFDGRIVNGTENVIKAAKRLHEAFPQIGIINWDFTVDKNGEAVLIEANTSDGSIWLPQFVHGKGAFGDKTAEILRWIRFMERINPEDRPEYQQGWTDSDFIKH